jgi:hypothetical protein
VALPRDKPHSEVMTLNLFNPLWISWFCQVLLPTSVPLKQLTSHKPLHYMLCLEGTELSYQVGTQSVPQSSTILVVATYKLIIFQFSNKSILYGSVDVEVEIYCHIITNDASKYHVDVCLKST